MLQSIIRSASSIKLLAPKLVLQQFRVLSTQVTKDLAQKLRTEHQHELDSQDSSTSFIKEFTNKSTWAIVDTPGQKEITLKRSYKTEQISIMFSTDALADSIDEPEIPSEEGEEGEEGGDTPVGLSIIVSSSLKEGALEITASAQDSTFFIENVSFFKNLKVADDVSAEGDWIRRGEFGGPTFEDLDEGLIESFHSYLVERGFDEELSEFIQAYVVHKEQTEYIQWLKNVSKFIEQ